MKKVVYSVYRTGKADSKISGIDCVREKDLTTVYVEQNRKPCITSRNLQSKVINIIYEQVAVVDRFIRMLI